MWLYEMEGAPRTTARVPPCHCRECQPCPHACCENMAVRSGLCCDPTTLGRCLQPYQTECYAPCCHHSVQLRENYRWVGGKLIKIEKMVLFNPLKGECELGEEVLEEYREVNDKDHDTINEEAVSEEESTSHESFEDDSYIPQIYSDQFISKYLDVKLGKVIQKSDFPVKSDFFKIYKDSSLPHGGRIVHKKRVGSTQMEFSYRSKCGKLFNTRTGLLFFVAQSEKSVMDENVNLGMYADLETSSKMFAEGLYQIKHRDGVKQDMMKCVQSYLREEDYAPLGSGKFPKQKEEIKPIVVSEAEPRDNIVQARIKSDTTYDGTFKGTSSKMLKSDLNEKIVAQSPHSRTEDYPHLTNPCPEKKIKIPSTVKSKVVGKTVFCEECEETLSLADMTKHIVVMHPRIAMHRCMICRSGLMNIESFTKHKQVYHAEEGSSHPAAISNIEQVPSEIESNIHTSVTGQIANTSSGDFNDSFETLDKIENFVKSSARSPHQSKSPASKSKRKNLNSSQEKLVKPSLHHNNSTPPPMRYPNQKTKKGFVQEEKQVKRTRSLDAGVTLSSKKRLRKAFAESLADTEIPLKDTDPEHPTSSFNLRKKGRKKAKKTTMDNLIRSTKNKYILDTSHTINDVVGGEVLITQSVKPECFFRISSSSNSSQPTSNGFRMVGKDLKGKKPQRRSYPLNNLNQEVVKHNVVNVGNTKKASAEEFCRISS